MPARERENMKLVTQKVNYKIRCEIDGCCNMAAMGISGRDDRPSARLHLCAGCLAQIAALGELANKPPISPINIFKKALYKKGGKTF